MGEALKALTSGPWNWLVSCVLPSVLVVSMASFFIVPHLPGLPLPSDAGERSATLAGVTVLVAVLLTLLNRSLYRILEGYLFWPECLRRARVEHFSKKSQTQSQGESDEANQTLRALATESLGRFPANPQAVAPTRLANAMRAIETYAQDRYELDSQVLWDELMSVVPEPTRAAVNSARASVDFLVNLYWLSATYAALALTVGLASGSLDDLWPTTVIGVLVLFPLYGLAVAAAADGLYDAVRALVNLGRFPLASSFGLELPKLELKEREMWRHLCWFVQNSYALDYSEELDEFRRAPRREDPGTVGSRSGSSPRGPRRRRRIRRT